MGAERPPARAGVRSGDDNTQDRKVDNPRPVGDHVVDGALLAPDGCATIPSRAGLLALQRTAGNRNVAALVARAKGPIVSPMPSTTRDSEPAAPAVSTSAETAADPATFAAVGAVGLQRYPVLQRNEAVGTPLTVQRDATPGGEKFEFKWDLNDSKSRVRFSARGSVNRKGATYLEGPTAAPGDAGTAKWSLLENKATIQRGAGKWGANLSSALANWGWSGAVPGFPYLKASFDAKAIEGKFDLVKKEADLDLLKFSVTLTGDAGRPVLALAGLGHLADRVEIKVAVKAEVGISPTDLARLKAAFRAKEELKAATEALEQHGKNYGKAADELEKLKKERTDLKAKVEAKTKAREKLQRQVEELEKAGPKGKGRRAIRKHKKKLEGLKRNLGKADAEAKAFERKLTQNTDKARDGLKRAKEARKGLGESGKTLQKAGRKLDDALKGVSGKLGGAGKKALDKATKKIMKKLGQTLAKKVLAKLVPGLNVISTVMDIVEIGSALWDLATGKRKVALPLEDELGGEEGEGEGGAGGAKSTEPEGTTQGEGEGAKEDESGGAPGTSGGGEGEGGEGEPGEEVALDPAVRKVLEGIQQTSTAMTPEEAELLNQLIPRDVKPEELEELRKRLGGSIGGTSDPYAISAAIQSELEDVRAGGTKVTIDGKEVAIDAEKAEPPKSLLPGTRSDVQADLVYDKNTGQMAIKEEAKKRLVGQTFTHADGLEVRISEYEASSMKPDDDMVFVSVKIALEVVKLPDGAGADYPFKEGQTDTEKMTFLYSPSKDMWGEMDYGIAHALRSLLTRDGGSWMLKQPGTVVAMQYAKVRVNKLIASDTVDKADGGVQHRFLLDITPIEITGEEAGYRHAGGWIKFEKGKSVQIPFAFSENLTPAGAK